MFFNFEQWLTDFYVGLITSLANFVAFVVKMVFIADSVTITGQQSTADLNVIEQVGTIVLVLALPLTIAAVIWQIIRSNAEGRISGVFRAILGGVLMVVLSRVAFWYGPVLITGFDQMTMQLIDTFNAGPGGIIHGLLESFGLEYDRDEDLWRVSDDAEGGVPAPTWMAAGMAVGATPIIPIVLLIILAVGGFLVMLMLGFRRWALIVMLALAPLALMFLPAEKASKGIAWKWLQIVLALLAAKPLAAIIMAVTARLMASSGEVNLLMLVVAMMSFMIAAAAPLIAMKFFGFMNAEIGHAYAQAAGEGALRGGARTVMSTGSQAQMLTSGMRRGGGGGSPAPISAGGTKTAAAQTVASSGGVKAVGAAAAGKGAAAAAGPAAPVVAAASSLAAKKPRRG